MGNFDISRIGKSFENNELSTEQKKKVEELENSIFDVSNMGLDSDEDIGDLLNFSFDEDGNISMEIDIDGNGEIDHVETYKFDDEGNITESITNTLDEVTGETLDTKQSTMEYDDSGRISTKTFTNSTGEDALTYTKTFDYGDENSTNVKSASWQSSNESDVSRTVEYNDDGSYKETMTDSQTGLYEENIYDTDGKLTSGITYDNAGNELYSWDFQHNEDNTMTVYQKDTEGNLISTQMYDENDRLISLKEKSEFSDTTDTTNYTYNEDGSIIQETINSSGTKSITETDSNGRITKTELYDEDGEIQTSYEYQYYGENNDFTTKVKNSDGEVTELRNTFYNDDGTYSTTFKTPEGKTNSVINYNENGEMTKSTDYDENGKSRGYFKYSYLNDGNTVKVRSYTSDDTFQGTHTDTMENNRVVSSTAKDAKGNVEARITYEYNSDGSYTMVYKNAEGKEYKTMEYDANGELVSSTDTE
ncbi:MAG: hypothetical protein LUG16_05210 [Candidatus Gastranaerophilales bacterium]|nr:hypothetical protein [Candidatus Gastranaerophilales bacterium]